MLLLQNCQREALSQADQAPGLLQPEQMHRSGGDHSGFQIWQSEQIQMLLLLTMLSAPQKARDGQFLTWMVCFWQMLLHLNQQRCCCEAGYHLHVPARRAQELAWEEPSQEQP